MFKLLQPTFACMQIPSMWENSNRLVRFLQRGTNAKQVNCRHALVPKGLVCLIQEGLVYVIQVSMSSQEISIEQKIDISVRNKMRHFV